MANVNNLSQVIVKQKEAEAELKRLMENFKKENKEQLKKLDRLNKWTGLINASWNEYVEGHRILHDNQTWKLLQGRYDNKRAINNMFLDNLMDLPRMTKDTQADMQQLIDTSREFIALLEGMTMEDIILRLLSKKLHPRSLENYESTLKNPKEPQKLEDFYLFLEQRSQILGSVEAENGYYKKPFTKEKNKKVLFKKCVDCGDARHPIYLCDIFKRRNMKERQRIVRENNLCHLCLKSDHAYKFCKSNLKCRECGKRHNTFLHLDNELESKPTISYSKSNTSYSKPGTSYAKPSAAYSKNNHQQKKAFLCTAEEKENSDESTVACVASSQNKGSKVLLATAKIRIKTDFGWSEEFGALLDQGSMATFITDDAVKKLKLKKEKNNVSVSGIGGVKTEKSLGSVNLEFTARYPSAFIGKTKAIILGKLTNLSPLSYAKEKINKINNFNQLILADPDISNTCKIDIILGADVYATLLLNGVIKAEKDNLVAQETQLGWIISGVLGHQLELNGVCLISTIDELNESTSV
ncbi:uncharacterized protein LOC116346759 [Contarinia nasturtii]|uniref:uncharacterized protein LOC116346759 n=1 Tax=Contarinia nasturtii TaxID=265458 RepID=UPI0012D44262|nr:uncharacterized protein LOC116346759 [Contarinia nasturtii]